MRPAPAAVPCLVLAATCALAAALSWAPLRAQGQRPRADDLEARVQTAVQRGLDWLLAQQTDGGDFRGQMQGRSGETALALLATLHGLKAARPEGGTADPRVEKGFDWLARQPMQWTYDTSLVLMALEARYTPPDEVIEKRNLERTTVVQRVFQAAAPKRDRRLAEGAVEWLLANRTPNLKMWRYPTPNSVDNSATQFAVLGLKAGVKLGVPVPKEVFVDVLEYFLADQQDDGPEVKPFSVPAADGRIASLPRQGAGGNSGGSPSGRGSVAGGPSQGAAGGASEAPRVFKARGWGYTPKDAPAEGGNAAPPQICSGSMTAAGVCSLVIAKSELEDIPGWNQRYGPGADRGIRDGMAWLAHHFQVDANPGSGGWTVYYLYGLERAGMLSGARSIGEHDWYREGAEQLLTWQQDDGSWEQDQNWRLVDTCFALLFLTRATPPVMPVEPRRPETGGGRR